MKKYLLLASVAGCLMASNAMAYKGTTDISADISITAKLAQAFSWQYEDVNFGNIVVSNSAAVDDIIAVFNNGVLSFTDGKVVSHGSEEAGWILLSSGGGLVTGVSFSATTVDLKDSSNNVVAQMVDIAPGPRSTEDQPKYFINGKLKLKGSIPDTIAGTEITGSVTATLQF